ncbi:MAG: DUF4114 domain-containing protein [bacterium]
MRFRAEELSESGQDCTNREGRAGMKRNRRSIVAQGSSIEGTSPLTYQKRQNARQTCFACIRGIERTKNQEQVSEIKQSVRQEENLLSSSAFSRSKPAMALSSLKSPEEGFAFQILNYGLDHQGGAVLDIFVNFDFKKNVGITDPYAYPEFVSVSNFIKNYLVSYPNETDFWEVLNRNLVGHLLTQTIPTTFGAQYQLDEIVDALTVDIRVESGSSLVNYDRASIVVGSPNGSAIDYKEGFSFAIADYGLDHQGGAVVDIGIDLDFKKDVAVNNPFAYPEFVSVVDFVKDYLVNYPNETDFWEVLNRNLTTELLTKTIPTTFGAQYDLDDLVEALTVDISVESGSSLVNYDRSSIVKGLPSASSIDFEESFKFSITDYGLDHQGGAVVDILINLDFKKDVAVGNPYAYPEFVSIVNFVKDYLVNYPNETDFWEILNKNLVTELLKETIPTTFGVEYHLEDILDSITVDIGVEPGSSLVNYSRLSQVKGSPTGSGINFDESFSFSISDYGLDHQGGAVVDILVDLDFKEGIGTINPFDYPEFVSIVEFIKKYLVDYPNETDFWEILNKNLTSALLTEIIPTNFGVEYQLSEVVDTIKVDIQVESGSSLVNQPRSSTVSQSVQSGPIQTGSSLINVNVPGGSVGINVNYRNCDLKPCSTLQLINNLGINAAGLTTLTTLGINTNTTGLDFELDVEPGSNASVNAMLELVAADIIPQLNAPTIGRRDDRKILYYGINTTGDLSSLTYDPITGAGARFYDLDNDGTADFFTLSLVDGGHGDKDGVINGSIQDPSVAGYVDLTNLKLSDAGSGIVSVGDSSNQAPAAVNLRTSLTNRPGNSNQIGYIVLNASEIANSAALLSDLNWIKGRAKQLLSTLENNDVTLLTTQSFIQDIQLINGQSIKFFEVVDAGLEHINTINDSRLRLLTPGNFGNGQVDYSTVTGLKFSLSLLDHDPGLNALVSNVQGTAPVLDLSIFTTSQNLSGTLVLGREADYDSIIGFYRTIDTSGTVLAADGVTRLRPGANGYAAAALNLANRVTQLNKLSVADNQTATLNFNNVSGGTFLAPFAQVKGNTFFAFGAANQDGISHFRSLGNNLLGLEDVLGGGDRDFDDVVMGFNFTTVS